MMPITLTAAASVAKETRDHLEAWPWRLFTAAHGVLMAACQRVDHQPVTHSMAAASRLVCPHPVSASAPRPHASVMAAAGAPPGRGAPFGELRERGDLRMREPGQRWPGPGQAEVQHVRQQRPVQDLQVPPGTGQPELLPEGPQLAGQFVAPSVHSWWYRRRSQPLCTASHQFLPHLRQSRWQVSGQ
jgi:hypothetical protein